MLDLKKAIARCEARLFRLKAAAAIEREIQAAFQTRYNEVVSKYILSVFRPPGEEMDHTHEHRAVKIVNGEIVRLRLDFLHGQADGIKAVFERGDSAMYIWFSPDTGSGKIRFKVISAAKGIHFSKSYDLDEIGADFLLELIGAEAKQLS